MARTVRPSRDSRIETVKPTLSPTLWQELDALYVEQGMIRNAKQPPGTFTAAQEARRCGLHASSISLRFQRLLKEGKLEFVGTGVNNQKYYRIKK